MHLRNATHRDLPAIQALVRTENLPDSDIAEHLATFLVGEQGGAIVAAGGFEVLGRIGLLRSVAVSARYRGRRWGRRVVARLILQARALGLTDLYLLTTTAVDFFVALGFRQLARDSAPPLIRRTRQFTGLCPASATLMRLDLTTEAP